MMRMEGQQQQGPASPPPRPPPRSSSSSNLSPQKASAAALSPWRPAVAVLHADCLFLRPSASRGKEADVELQPAAVLPRFGTEQLLEYLRAQQPPLAVTVAAPSASSRALLAAARADPTLVPLLDGVRIVPPLSSQLGEDDVVRGGNHEEEADRSPEALLAFVVEAASSSSSITGSNGMGLSGGGGVGPVMVIGPTRAPSPTPEQDEQLQQQNGEQQPRFVAVVLPWPPTPDKNNNGASVAVVPSNGHHVHWPADSASASASPPPRQEGSGCVATGVEWARLGLPPLVVDVQNPPFLWPRDYERREGAARLVEARWWDPQHGQLNLVLGRGVRAGNVLEAVTAETHKADGTLALPGLESVFVTVRHDFGLMARMLADSYRIHHAAGGGTEVVLLRRFVKVEVPTAGTHIVRSKVILFRRRSRLNGGSDSGSGSAGGVSPQLPPSPSPVEGGRGTQEAEALEQSPSKALLLAGMRRRSRSVGSQAEAAGWEDGDEEDVEIFLFRRRAKGIWKMPGGHVEMKELADEAAVRELRVRERVNEARAAASLLFS